MQTLLIFPTHCTQPITPPITGTTQQIPLQAIYISHTVMNITIPTTPQQTSHLITHLHITPVQYQPLSNQLILNITIPTMIDITPFTIIHTHTTPSPFLPLTTIAHTLLNTIHTKTHSPKTQLLIKVIQIPIMVTYGLITTVVISSIWLAIVLIWLTNLTITLYIYSAPLVITALTQHLILVLIITLNLSQGGQLKQHKAKQKIRWIRHRNRTDWINVKQLAFITSIPRMIQQLIDSNTPLTQENLLGGGKAKTTQNKPKHSTKPYQKQQQKTDKDTITINMPPKHTQQHNKKTKETKLTDRTDVVWLVGAQAEAYLNQDKAQHSRLNIPIAGIPEGPQSQTHDSLSPHLMSLKTQQTSVQTHKNLIMVSSGVHWVLLVVNNKTHITIWDPYATPIPSILRLKRVIQQAGWNSTLESTGQQPTTDTDTCGYRVMLWIMQATQGETQQSRGLNKWTPQPPTDITLTSIYQTIQTQYPVDTDGLVDHSLAHSLP